MYNKSSRTTPSKPAQKELLTVRELFGTTEHTVLHRALFVKVMQAPSRYQLLLVTLLLYLKLHAGELRFRSRCTRQSMLLIGTAEESWNGLITV